VDPESVGLKGSPTIVSELNAQEENKRQAEMISGTRDEKADTLVQKLVDAGVL
jgi:electron transfer flavoprotein alpha/beta subunit